jgi:hypothetical protein
MRLAKFIVFPVAWIIFLVLMIIASPFATWKWLCKAEEQLLLKKGGDKLEI